MIDSTLLLEVLRFLFVAYGFYRNYRLQQREKALIAELERFNQRLAELENITSKKLDE